jgi:hypothetical protein
MNDGGPRGMVRLLGFERDEISPESVIKENFPGTVST